MSYVDSDHQPSISRDEFIANDPFKELEFTKSQLKKQLELTKIIEDNNKELKKKLTSLECQNEIMKARIDLINKEDLAKNRNPRVPNQEYLMEVDMLKAQISSSTLKAIVIPLEQENLLLKKSLAESEARLKVSYMRSITLFPEVPIDETSTVDITDNPSTDDEVAANRIIQLESRCAGLEKKLLEAELFVASLSKHNDYCEKQISSLKEEINEKIQLLSEERARGEELKETWEKANEQFIIQSINFQKEIKNLQEEILKNTDGSKSFTFNKSEESALSDNSVAPESNDYSDKMAFLESEVEFLKSELANERRRYSELELSVPETLQSSFNQLNKCELDVKNLDTFLVSIQEEFARVLSKLEFQSQFQDFNNKDSSSTDTKNAEI